MVVIGKWVWKKMGCVLGFTMVGITLLDIIQSLCWILFGLPCTRRIQDFVFLYLIELLARLIIQVRMKDQNMTSKIQNSRKTGTVRTALRSFQRMPTKRSGQSPDLIENLKVKNKCELKARSSKRKTWWRKWIRWWWYWLWFVAFTYINGNLCGQKTQSFSRNQESSQNCQITESGKPYIHGYLVVKGHKVQMSGKLLNKVWSTSFFWYIFS